MSELPEKPETVCLCGSTRFKDAYRSENRRLTMEGKIVLSVGLFGHADNVDLEDEEKEMLDTLHKRKIDLADRIHVINVDGYIGDSTQSEIEYARATDTPITYLEEPTATDGGLTTADTQLIGHEYDVTLHYLVEHHFRVKAGPHENDAIEEADLLRSANRPNPADRELVHTETQKINNIYEDDPDAHEVADWIDPPSAPSEETYWDDTRHFNIDE